VLCRLAISLCFRLGRWGLPINRGRGTSRVVGPRLSSVY
jgi:hypothetical protein